MYVRLKTFLLLVSPLLLLVAAAYLQWGTVGLPTLATSPTMTPETAAEPYGFPAWLCITHYVNFLFLILLLRSGLQILMERPRLHWNVQLRARHRMAPAHAGRGAQGSRLDGKR